jgi:hypothetical protein
MDKDKINNLLNGKFVFQNSPGKRALFHLVILGPIIVFGSIFVITGDFPPPDDFKRSSRLIFIPFQILILFWIWWFIRAFITYIIVKHSDTLSNTSKEEMYNSFQIATGKCPYCFNKISKFATKCPKCTADL